MAPTLAWEYVSTAAVDPDTGLTELIPIQPATGRNALRVSSGPSTCFQVAHALAATGEVLADPFAGSDCRDCVWRTSRIQQAGVLVLDGPAARLSQVAFRQIDCRTGATRAEPGEITVEHLVTPAPTAPSLTLRLVVSDQLDTERLATDVGQALGLSVEVAAVVSVHQGTLALDGPSDVAPLADLLAGLPPRDEGVVDVVIGPCLVREDPFGTHRLAGFTPRIPGGAGPAGAVFVSRQSCGSRDTAPDRPDAAARVVAHELGHYLGLFHTQEADGTEDQFADTALDNLMHRFPLLRDAHGLSDAQMDRLLAHPFVR